MATGLTSSLLACRNVWALLVLSAVPAIASAQALPDPTRPPAEISAPPEQAAVPKESGLQSVIISPTRRAAIINGQTVKLGAKLGDAKLVEVSESGVVLQGPQGRQVLAMFPGVELKKKAVVPPEQKNKNAKPVLNNVEGRAAEDSRHTRKADEHAASKEKK